MRTENQNYNLDEIYVPYIFNILYVISIIIDVYKYCLKLMYLPVGCLFTVHGNWPSMVTQSIVNLCHSVLLVFSESGGLLCG